MSVGKETMLIDYLDNTLQGEEKANAERLISQDTELSTELQHLQTSVELVREAAVLNQVKTVRADFNTGAKVVEMSKREGAHVIRFTPKIALRAAAAVLLLMVSFTAYKYAVVSPSRMYDRNFSSFELSTSRGNDNDGNLEKAYRNKDWTGVIKMTATASADDNKAQFLRGMAAMELRHFNLSTVAFEQILANNKQKSETYFQDESEYYLALSYLHAGNSAAGVALLRKIKADPNHLYNKLAEQFSATDLVILEHK